MTLSSSSKVVNSKIRLVAFDVEGVLIPKNRYLLFEATRRLDFIGFLRILWAGLLYEIGVISLESALTRIYRQLRGLTIEDVLQLYKSLPLIPGVREVFERLKRGGYKTALISSGLPQILVGHLASELGADYAYGLNIEINEGCLTGEISGDVIQTNGKAVVLAKIMRMEGLAPQECALVADDRNNLPMFKLCGLKVGYNPDFVLSAKSDVVVRGTFGEILLPIAGESTRTVVHSVANRDLIREAIHLSGFLVPVVTAYIALSPSSAALLIFIVTSVYAMSELARMLGHNIPLASTITLNAAIAPEIYEFAASPIFFALGIMLALLVFPAPASYGAITVFTLGDSLATLFGKKFGRHVFPYNKGKKVEGTVFGLLFAWLGALFFVVDPWKALVGAAIGMLVETLPLPLSDNLTVPMISGLTLLVIA